MAIGPGERLPGVYLALRAADREGLVSAEQVEELLWNAALTPVEADFRGHVVGTFVHRGETLVALDLASILGAPRPAPAACCLLVLGGARSCGLLVDSVTLLSEAPVVLSADPEASGKVPWRVEVACGRGVLPVLNVPALAVWLEDPASGACPARLAVQQLQRDLLWRLGITVHGPLRDRLEAHLGRWRTETETPPSEALPRILGGREAVVALLESAMAGEGYFMRHPEQFDAVRRMVAARDAGLPPFRAWSAGCGAGEEPYSLAMAMIQAGARPGVDRVVATDVSEGALAHARAGRYGRWSFRREHPELQPFLAGGPEIREVVPAVRRLVELRRHDLLLDEPPEGDLDLILCRNVLSLLDPAVAGRVAKEVFRALRPGGYLLLGATETGIGEALPAERVSRGGATLFRRPWRRRARRSRPAAAA